MNPKDPQSGNLNFPKLASSGLCEEQDVSISKIDEMEFPNVILAVLSVDGCSSKATTAQWNGAGLL